MKFAVVDIETTGGRAKLDGITEIAIVVLEDGVEVDRYQTLINPNRIIPRKIVALTGITNEMVEQAPQFHEVAKEIWDRTHGAVFVAHNVNFDYGFIRTQFSQLGALWRPKRLCTVRLSRKLIPGLYSYSLGKIATQLGYEIEERHRAMGDCDFTVTLFQKLLKLDDQGVIDHALNPRTREATMPPNFDRKKFDLLPETQGVYIFKGSRGRVLYVGKANNLKKRVSEHLRGNTHTGFKSRFAEKIEDLDWINCPNELICLLTEAEQIKKYWPPYNRAMKRVSLNWGVYSYKDQSGYMRLSIGRVGKWDRPLISFQNRTEAKMRVEFICLKHELCERLCGLQELSGSCLGNYGTCHQACIGVESPEAYNKRYDAAIHELTDQGKTLLIKGRGFEEGESSIVLIEAGRYKGHGIMPDSVTIESIESVKEFIETGYDDQDIQSVILGQLARQAKDMEVIAL